MPAWLLFFPLAEAAWLAGLWLFVPETRPWHRPPGSAAAPSGPLRTPRIASAYLALYMLYHLPVLLVLSVFSGDVFREFGERISPLTFILVGVCTAVGYATAWQMLFGAPAAV
jgi:hypothetical protein